MMCERCVEVDDGVLLVVRGDRIYYSVLSRYSHYALKYVIPTTHSAQRTPERPQERETTDILVWGGL